MNVIDQSAANMYLRDDPSMSFACRVYSIFALYVLGNPRVFNMLRDGLTVLPWYCTDNTYSDWVKSRFQWRPTYGESQDTMNAHFNFWYQQVFHNRTLDFQYFETSGIGAYAKVPGVLYSYTHDLYGFLEFVSEDVFRHLKEDLGHWSLFCYRDKELEWHYCVLFGTVALINHDTMATGKLQVLNGEFDAEESIFQFDYYWSAGRTVDQGNLIAIDVDVLILKVIRHELYITEAIPDEVMAVRDDLYTRVNVQDINYYGCRLRRYEVGDQLYINYGSNFSYYK
jgi:hypothetical protein